MHVKSLVFDERVVLTGSTNMTHNGHEKNKEHMYRIAHRPTVAEVVADFEKDWKEAMPLTQDLIDSVVAKSLARSEERTRSQSRSRSKARPRSQARSSSSALEPEENEDEAP